MYDYISPEKILTALRWLKRNNPLYADIDVNEEWLEQAMANNEDLFAGLVKPNDMYMYSDSNRMNSQCVLPTEQPNNEHGVNNYGSSSNQHDDDQSMESCPSSLSTGNDVFTVAFNVLERVAKEFFFYS